jgi:hypothetical protein
MSIYHLLDNVTAITSPAIPKNSPLAQPTTGQIGQPSSYQAVTVTVTAPSSNAISATVQLMVSNDGVNWSNYGTAITASGTGTAFTVNQSLQASFAFWGAIVTAISGTGAAVTCLLSA